MATIHVTGGVLHLSCACNTRYKA